MQVNKPRSKPILISSWYRRPDTPIAIFDDFEELIAKINSIGHEIFLLGDFKVNFEGDVGFQRPKETWDLISQLSSRSSKKFGKYL